MEGLSNSNAILRKEHSLGILDLVLQQEFVHLASARPNRSETVEGVTLLSSMRFLPSIKAMEDSAASNAIQKQLLYVTLAAVTKC